MVVAPGARPALRARVLALVVQLLTIGVIAMHSLGTTHQMPMPMPIPTVVPAAVLAAADITPAHAWDAPSSSPHPSGLMGMPPSWVTDAVVDSSTSIALSTPHTGSAASMAGDAAIGGHGLMAMCLAVVPLLVLLLRRAPSGWFRLLEHRPVQPRSAVRQMRARWPAAADVSLSRLCVLRR